MQNITMFTRNKNKSVKGFGSYGDIMICDRKMYVAPTPFALTEGTTGLITLIVPDRIDADSRFQEVGRLSRFEAETLIVGYCFDLETNELKAQMRPNPNAGNEHKFIAYRLTNQGSRLVTMAGVTQALDKNMEGNE